MGFRTKARIRASWRSFVACALWILGTASTVSAEPTDSERAQARSLMNEGDRRRSSGDLWGARERFQKAHGIMHVPTTAFELARIQAQISQLVEAQATALAVADMRVQDPEPQPFAVARANAAQLAQELAHRVPDITLSIEPRSALTRLLVDGIDKPSFTSSVPMKLNPGTHVLSIEAAGFTSETRQILLAEAQHAELHVQLKPAVAQANSGAPPLPALSANVLRDVQPYPAARTRGFIAAAAGGMVLAAGAASGIWSALEAGAIRDQCQGDSCPESVRDRRDFANTMANIANIAVPVGVLGLGYGLFEILTHPYPVQEQRMATKSIRLSVDPLRVRITLRGAL